MILINKNLCDLCGSCVAVCPQNCMEIIHYNLAIDDEKCIDCKNCITVCPVRALEMVPND